MTIVLIRHIKSDWSFGTSDFDRVIREDRKVDAVKISGAVKTKGISPDLVIASPAKRTQQTAKLFCKEFEYDFKKVVLDQSLYESSMLEIVEAIANIPTGIETIFIICHNPSITDFINNYTNSRIDNVPTCGCAVIDYTDSVFKLKTFIYPKLFS